MKLAHYMQITKVVYAVLLFAEVLTLFMSTDYTHESHLQNETPRQRVEEGYRLKLSRIYIQSSYCKPSTVDCASVWAGAEHTHECDILPALRELTV